MQLDIKIKPHTHTIIHKGLAMLLHISHELTKFGSEVFERFHPHQF